LSKQSSIISDKFSRVFEQIDDCKQRLTKVEVYEEVEQQKIDEIAAKLNDVSTTLNQIIGRESVRASIYGVIGAVISGIVVWLVTRISS